MSARVAWGVALLWLGMAPAAAWASPVRAGIFAGDPVALIVAVDVAPGWRVDGALGVSPGAVRGAVLGLGIGRDLTAPVLELFDGALQPTLGLGFRLALTRAVRADEAVDVLPGVRVPAGVAWRRAGAEIFVELAPGVDFGGRARVSLEGGLGVRITLGG